MKLALPLAWTGTSTALVALGLAVTAVALAGCGGAPRALTPSEDGTYHVLLTASNTFSPPRGTLPVGANVTFISQGNHDVQVTGPMTGSSGGPGDMGPGATWNFQFTQPGTYTVKCHVHSGIDMKASFTVAEPSAAPA